MTTHDALKDDINLNRPRFEDMDKLAGKLTRGGSPEASKIKQDNQELQAILNKLDEDWEVILKIQILIAWIYVNFAGSFEYLV